MIEEPNDVRDWLTMVYKQNAQLRRELEDLRGRAELEVAWNGGSQENGSKDPNLNPVTSEGTAPEPATSQVTPDQPGQSETKVISGTHAAVPDPSLQHGAVLGGQVGGEEQQQVLVKTLEGMLKGHGAQPTTSTTTLPSSQRPLASEALHVLGGLQGRSGVSGGDLPGGGQSLGMNGGGFHGGGQNPGIGGGLHGGGLSLGMLGGFYGGNQRPETNGSSCGGNVNQIGSGLHGGGQGQGGNTQVGQSTGVRVLEELIKALTPGGPSSTTQPNSTGTLSGTGGWTLGSSAPTFGNGAGPGVQNGTQDLSWLMGMNESIRSIDLSFACDQGG